MCPPTRSSRIFYGAGEYGTRDRCREDFYTLASTPIPLSDVESIGSTGGGPLPNQNSVALQQSALQKQQSPSTQSNVSSVFYTVQRVITTSQIQTSGAYVGGNNDCGQGNGILQMPPGIILSNKIEFLLTCILVLWFNESN